MKLLTRLALLGAVSLSQSAWADTGPFYVSYTGYCNVEKVYLNAFTDVYGTEVGCTSSLGRPLIGSFTVDGRVMVSVVGGSGQPCINAYWTDGTLHGGCSAGGSITYNSNSTYAVREAVRTGSEVPPITYKVSTEMPDLEQTKNLPSRFD